MTVFGLPLHILLVHAVVVLVPLAATGGLAIALLRWARLRYGELVLVGAFGAAVSTYIAQESGENFAATFEQVSPKMAEHFAIGDSLLVWAVLLFLGVATLVVAQRLVDRNHSQGRLMLLVGALVTVVSAVVAVVQTVRIGHSGAVAVWGGL
ncbi:MAG TPA: DUF2231 domain-containing protein [Propionibacteriaceae bacterium]|nr:DUF2231 domain-containing protein [Propionibacteriaceae bacterium]